MKTFFCSEKDCIRSKQGQMRRIQKILNAKEIIENDEAPANKERNAIINAATSTPRSNKLPTHDFATPRTLRVSYCILLTGIWINELFYI